MLPTLYLTPQLHEMFWEMNKTHHFTGMEMKLYFHLVRLWAERGGKPYFWESEADICSTIGIAANTLRKGRKHLETAGLISVISGGKSYGDKTRYSLTLNGTPFEPPTGTDDNEQGTSPVDTVPDLPDSDLTNSGSMVLIDEAFGLRLLIKQSDNNIKGAKTRVVSNDCRVQNQVCTLPKNNDTYTSSFSEEKKTVKKENPTGSFSSQAALFQEERPTPPNATEIYTFIEEMLKREKGDVPLTTIDRELIHAIAQKFIAAKQCSDWRDDKSQNCMIRYWRERLQRYYASAKWGTRSDIQRAYNAEAAARNIELNAQNSQKFAAEKEAYIIRLQAEQAAEAAKKQAFDATVQTAILTKVENNNITFIPRNNGNARPNNANKSRNHSGNVATPNSESIDAFVARKLAEARAEEAALRAA